MGNQVDNQVVAMKFDNKGFSEKVSSTIAALDKLREKLSFKGADKGLQDIDAAAKKVNLESMATAIDSIMVNSRLWGPLLSP